MNSLKQTIRQVLAQHGRLPVKPAELADDTDLYESGFTSLATVGVMLALENQLDVEFSVSLLNRRTFQSINGIAEAITELRANAGDLTVVA